MLQAQIRESNHVKVHLIMIIKRLDQRWLTHQTATHPEPFQMLDAEFLRSIIEPLVIVVRDNYPPGPNFQLWPQEMVLGFHIVTYWLRNSEVQIKEADSKGKLVDGDLKIQFCFDRWFNKLLDNCLQRKIVDDMLAQTRLAGEKFNLKWREYHDQALLDGQAINEAHQNMREHDDRAKTVGQRINEAHQNMREHDDLAKTVGQRINEAHQIIANNPDHDKLKALRAFIKACNELTETASAAEQSYHELLHNLRLPPREALAKYDVHKYPNENHHETVKSTWPSTFLSCERAIQSWYKFAQQSVIDSVIKGQWQESQVPQYEPPEHSVWHRPKDKDYNR